MISFTKVPNFLLKLAKKKHIDPYHIAIYFAIISHKNQRTGLCCPTEETISNKINCSKKTVQRKLHDLIKIGLLVRSRKGFKGTYRYDEGTHSPLKWDSESSITRLNNNTNKQDNNKLKKPYNKPYKEMDVYKRLEVESEGNVEFT